MSDDHDVVVVGSGPNGLAAAIAVAQQGRSVLVVEAKETAGGGMRSAELTLPGFVHDICSTIVWGPLLSPFLKELPLSRHGLELVNPEIPLAHPLDDGSAAVLQRSVEATAATLGPDERAYNRVFGPLVRNADAISQDVLGPLIKIPRHPFAMARFGLRALRSCTGLVTGAFETEPARALVAGIAAHSMLPLTKIPTAAVGLMLSTFAHSHGWPYAIGGTQKLADAMVAYLNELGGELVTGREVRSISEFPKARAVIFDVTPKQLVAIAGDELPGRYRRALGRFRYGPGVFKIDWALDGPVPWTPDGCNRAAVVHVAGPLADVVRSEDDVTRGVITEKPYVLLCQPSSFDPTRAPEGKHTLWAYCHVPNGSTEDMADRMEAQVERFAPGFRDRIIARHTMGPAQMEAHNANYIGGDINGGIQDIGQLFTRPVARLDPYSTPNKRIYLCSSSTPPGGGVHGMGGYHAARAALKRAF